MTVLNRIRLALEAIALVVGMSFFGLLGAVAIRLKRFVTAEALNHLLFSESVPVPRGNVVDQYGQQRMRSQASKTSGILDRSMWYGLIANTCLFLLARIIHQP